MTRGFYDQLGVEPTASPDAIRQAYLRMVTQYRRRRQALIERGGDPERLELARSQADESYAVLSDPERRRRYDALLALLETGIPEGEDALWESVEGAVVGQALGAAIEMLQHTTDLALQTFPEAPGAEPEPEPEPEPLTQAVVVPLPTREGAAPSNTASEPPGLRVVDGARAGAPVIVMPTPSHGTPTHVPPEPEPEPEPELPPGPPGIYIRMGPTGAMLAAVREHLGMSVDDLAEQTHIASRFLQAIEEEAFDRLPSATFVRGYVREMASLLELDEDDVVEGYMERFHGAR